MTISSPTSSSVDVRKGISEANVMFRNAADAVAFFCHCTMLNSGYINTDEDWELVEEADSTSPPPGGPPQHHPVRVPEDWNAKGMYAFCYRDPETKGVLELKLVKMGGVLSIMAMAQGDEESVVNAQLTVSQFAAEGDHWDLMDFYKKPRELEVEFKKAIIHKFKPPPEEEEEPKPEPKAAAPASSLQIGEPRRPGGDYPYPGIPSHMEPERGEDPLRDPLRVVRPGMGRQGGRPFGIGSGDVFPGAGDPSNVFGPEAFRGGRLPRARYDPVGPAPDRGAGPDRETYYGVPDNDVLLPPGSNPYSGPGGFGGGGFGSGFGGGFI